MPRCEIDDIFNGPWGMVEHRRAEIETKPYGAFDRIHKEEMAKNFLRIERAAEKLQCCASNARAWLAEHNTRYVVEGGVFLYYKQDVDKAIALRKRELAARAAKQKEKVTKKGKKKAA